ncbi:MAG: hypothetical protein ACK43K_03870, partial [Chitinophagales bacterium]
SFIFLFILLLFVFGIFFTDNPFKEYIDSSIQSENVKCDKSIKINLNDLDKLLSNNPNTIFYFFTYYCSPCVNSIEKGYSYDSVSRKKIIYISIDNYTTIEKICPLACKNPNFDKFYYLSDDNLTGYHFTRGRKVFELYAPTINKEYIAYPFVLYSNETGKIDSLSFGSEMK